MKAAFAACAALPIGVLFASGALSMAQPPSSPPALGQGWEPLFNGRNLDGWYTFLPSTGKNRDPQGVFRVERGMIHILGIPASAEKQEFGYLATNAEFSHCRIHAEFKWGTRRFPPREEDKRDSGLLYYFVGPDKIWPTSLEFQIEEGDVGDLWILGGATITTKVETQGYPMYVLSGPTRTQSAGRIIKFGDFEDRNAWNSVEAILDGDRITHLVNGRAVMRAWDLKQPDPQDASKSMALDRGRVMLEAEGAEIWFRNIQVKRLGGTQ
jgi:hypothetical protein